MALKAPRSKHILIQRRRSKRTGETFFYGDFRRYADVGGKVEPLRAPSARTATTDPAEAARLYGARVAELEAARVAAASQAGVPIMAAASSHVPVSIVTSAAAPPPRLRLDDLTVVHIKRKSLPRSGRRPSTVQRDREALAIVSRILDNPFVDDITPQLCDEYVLRREREPGIRPGTTVAARTIINEVHSLSNLLKRAVSMGILASNPVARMSEKPAVPTDEAAFLTDEEAARLLDTAAELDDEARRAKEASQLRAEARRLGDGRRRGKARELRRVASKVEGPDGVRHPYVGRHYTDLEVFLAVLLYTGARLTEALGLKVGDVDFNGRRVWLVPNEHRLLKHDRHRREVPLWPPLELLLHDYLARTGIGEGLLFPGKKPGRMMVSIHKMFRRCVARAGLVGGKRHVSPHTLRHTYATKLLQTLVRTEGGQLAVRSSFDVAKRLGHRSSALVDAVYGHLVPNPKYTETVSFEECRRYPASRLVLASLPADTAAD